MDLNAITIFVKVVEAGTFVGAARAAEIPKSTVARRVDELEASLGVRLLQRSTRKLSLTEAGRTYYERCRELIGQLEDATASISSQGVEPQGKLRFTTSVLMAETYLGEWCLEYLRQYPKVELDMYLATRRVDLVAEGFDLAIRVGPLEPSGHIVRKLAPAPRYVCASPAYLEEHGRPQTPRDLRDHQCVAFSPDRTRTPWVFEDADGQSFSVPITGKLVVNSYPVALQACQAGLGIAHLPGFLCCEGLRAGTLVPLLREWGDTHSTVHALYPSRHHLSPAVRTFLDFIAEKVKPSQWVFDTEPASD
ncbi:MAG: LysR family transcriptional regulator [Myxococcota bacterium]